MDDDDDDGVENAFVGGLRCWARLCNKCDEGAELTGHIRADQVTSVQTISNNYQFHEISNIISFSVNNTHIENSLGPSRIS